MNRPNRSDARLRLPLGEAERTVEDRLRQEYFTLLPEIRRVADRLEAEVSYHIRLISARLRRHERLTVKCRVKSCESALEKLRARQEGAAFDESRPEIYTLTGLNDLAGVRVLAFPRGRLAEIDSKLRKVFPSWTADPSRTTATSWRSNTTASAGRATGSRENIRLSPC